MDGRPTLRTPQGEREPRPGDTTIFRRGPEGAHKGTNRFDGSARFVMVSTMVHPEVAHDPDSDEIAIFAGAPPVPGEDAPIELIFDKGDATDHGELSGQALDRDPQAPASASRAKRIPAPAPSAGPVRTNSDCRRWGGERSRFVGNAGVRARAGRSLACRPEHAPA